MGNQFRRIWLCVGLMLLACSAVALAGNLGLSGPITVTGVQPGITAVVTPGLSVRLGREGVLGHSARETLLAVVTNHSRAPLQNATLRLDVVSGDPGGLQTDNLTRTWDLLQAGTRQVRWNVRANTPGTYGVSAFISATDPASGAPCSARSQTIFLTLP